MRNEEHKGSCIPALIPFLTSLLLPLLICSYGDRVEHFRVLEGGGQYCIWDESFSSLNRLVDFYRTHSIAVEKVICLRDPPSSPHLAFHSGFNPYPNPYSSSQESLLSTGLCSHPSHPQGGSSSHPVMRARQVSVIILSSLFVCETHTFWLTLLCLAETSSGSCPL